MFYRLALASCLMIASAYSFPKAALADTANVTFTGTVPVTTVVNVTNGTSEIVSGGSGGSNGAFESVAPAKVAVQSTKPTTVIVSPPRFVSGPTTDPSGTKYIGFLRFGSGTLRSDVGGGSGILPGGNTNLEVNMSVQRPDFFPPGTYTYAVDITFTP